MGNKEPFDQWHDDPSNWRWGVFYYNKKGKRLFPPKRLKAFGWMVNFANPYSILTLYGNYYPVSRNRFLYMIMINGYETQGKPWILIPVKALAN